MAISMYTVTVATFTRMLTNLLRILEKAEANAAERKIAPEVFVASRLAPDMHPLAFQIQSATDRAKFAVARITGQTPPSWADDEKTLEDLRGRIKKALDYLAGFKEADMNGTEDKMLTIKVRGEDRQVRAEDHVVTSVHPNFYFHVTTAYDILRHNGVPVGKRDFTGA
jgi:uncharacterized protein